MRRSWIALSALLLCGCYEYLAPQRERSLTGRRVQLTLTDVGSALLAPMIGPGNEAVEGMLSADTAGVYAIALALVRNRSGVETGWKGELVHVPHTDVSRLEERAFSKRRTVVGSIVFASALVSITRALRGPGGSTVGGPTPGGPGSGR